MLGSAIAFKFTKVVFIHGIGNGTLKQSIIKRLQEYEDIEFRTASFAKYGNGAIELIIHRNQ
jgi:dsDNA-specific endonuclease/ATPase MutS2